MNGEHQRVARGQPIWVLVVDAARQLAARGQTPFKLSELIAEVQTVDPARARESIQPVVQGMTVNAGKGPPSPCGKMLVRVSHGHYQLQSAESELPLSSPGPAGLPTTRPRAPRRQRTKIRERVEALIDDFDHWADVYDDNVPFTRSGQYELHRRTIDRRQSLGSAAAATQDDEFTELLYETLQAWGIGRRASRLIPLADFRRSLAEHTATLGQLDAVELEDATEDLSYLATALDALVSDLHVVDNQARIVAGTKTLHHLLPSLIPPMDRAWTGAFFRWSPIDPQYNQSEIFRRAFETFGEIARATRPSRLVGRGWRTSSTKILDNALIGYCKTQEIGGTSS